MQIIIKYIDIVNRAIFFHGGEIKCYFFIAVLLCNIKTEIRKAEIIWGY